MKQRLVLGEIDLIDGILPITRAAAGLAEVIRRAKDGNAHIVVTQNGYSTAVIMDIQSYKTMRKLAEERLAQLAGGEIAPKQ
jgi:prevent-host-death family protein